MNRTLKALGLGLFAALAMSAFAVLGASASELNHTGGHFTHDSALNNTANLHGLGGTGHPGHSVHLKAFGSTVTCTETYEGQATAKTVTSVTITATYSNCKSGETAASVNMNGCTYTFTIRQTNARSKHSPVHLKCAAGKKAEVTVSGQCVITFGEQQITAAVVYTQITELGKHAITADITASGITYEKHGLCEFLSPFGTGPHSGAELVGSATLTGTNTAGEPINLTATGTNGV